MQALLDVIIPVFLVLGAGYLSVWSGLFSESATDALMTFSQNFAIPCLLFTALSSLDLEASFNLPLLFSFYLGAVLGFLAGLMGARFLFGRAWTDAVAIGFCCLFSNSLLLGLPITERAYGPDALAGNYAIIALHSPFCYFLGITTMELVRNSGRSFTASMTQILTAMFKNMLILGIALGLLVNVLDVTPPRVFQDGIDLLTRAALPSALFALGGVLVRYRPEGDLKVIVMVCLISLVLHPLISWGTATALNLDNSAFRSLILTAAMAPGVSTYLFANMYGSAKRVAATSVLAATAASIGTALLWLLFLP